MVDKVDRPDAPPAYAVKAPTETKKDKPREERRQEDLPTFKKQEESIYREKFQGESGALKTAKVTLAEVAGLLFKRAVPRHGIPMADADLVWKDGKQLAGVSFLLKNWQDFMHIKNLKPGEKIPPPFWNYQGSQLEITIRSVATSGPWNLREIETEAAPVMTTKIPWWQNNQIILGGSVGILVLAILIILFLVGS